MVAIQFEADVIAIVGGVLQRYFDQNTIYPYGGPCDAVRMLVILGAMPKGHTLEVESNHTRFIVVRIDLGRSIMP